MVLSMTELSVSSHCGTFSICFVFVSTTPQVFFPLESSSHPLRMHSNQQVRVQSAEQDEHAEEVEVGEQVAPEVAEEVVHENEKVLVDGDEAYKAPLVRDCYGWLLFFSERKSSNAMSEMVHVLDLCCEYFQPLP